MSLRNLPNSKKFSMPYFSNWNPSLSVIFAYKGMSAISTATSGSLDFSKEIQIIARQVILGISQTRCLAESIRMRFAVWALNSTDP